MSELRDKIRIAVKEADDEDYQLTDKQIDAILAIINKQKNVTRQSWEFLGLHNRGKS
jgi:hypothetical protein